MRIKKYIMLIKRRKNVENSERRRWRVEPHAIDYIL